jgi:hypothetical protein
VSDREPDDLEARLDSIFEAAARRSPMTMEQITLEGLGWVFTVPQPTSLPSAFTIDPGIAAAAGVDTTGIVTTLFPLTIELRPVTSQVGRGLELDVLEPAPTSTSLQGTRGSALTAVLNTDLSAVDEVVLALRFADDTEVATADDWVALEAFLDENGLVYRASVPQAVLVLRLDEADRHLYGDAHLWPGRIEIVLRGDLGTDAWTIRLVKGSDVAELPLLPRNDRGIGAAADLPWIDPADPPAMSIRSAQSG